MATVEHCLYCFETLAAHLEKRAPMSLAELEKSYAEYVKAEGEGESAAAAAGDKLGKANPALRRLAAPSSSLSSGSSSPSSTLSSGSAGGQQHGPGSGADTPATSTSSLPVTESPLFVTWNIQHPRYGYNLRGCIGTFEPLEIDEGLASYAVTAAIHDMRFNPISLAELPQLEAAVTLLTDFEDAAGPDDWEVGTHGLRLSFHYHGKRYGSTYLPDVAPEQGWNKEETVVSLMRKAGWMGRKDKWREVDLKVVRYQGRRESVEYADFKQWRDWADEHTK